MDISKKRNVIGFVGWLAVALVINLLALVPMVLRELKQKRELGLKELEWDDILRYGIAILLGSGVQGLALQWVLGM